jgi:hypothetical protein
MGLCYDEGDDERLGDFGVEARSESFIIAAPISYRDEEGNPRKRRTTAVEGSSFANVEFDYTDIEHLQVAIDIAKREGERRGPDPEGRLMNDSDPEALRRIHRQYSDGTPVPGDAKPQDLLDAAKCYIVAADYTRGNMSNPGLWENIPAWVRDSAAFWPWDEDLWRPDVRPTGNAAKAAAYLAKYIEFDLREQRSAMT